MSLEELYRSVILDHYRNPRRRGSLEGDHVHAEGQNPSCGDEFSLDLAVDGDTVVDAAIQGQGCSISQASGSMMAEAIVKAGNDARRAAAGLARRVTRAAVGAQHGLERGGCLGAGHLEGLVDDPRDVGKGELPVQERVHRDLVGCVQHGAVLAAGTRRAARRLRSKQDEVDVEVLTPIEPGRRRRA